MIGEREEAMQRVIKVVVENKPLQDVYRNAELDPAMAFRDDIKTMFVEIEALEEQIERLQNNFNQARTNAETNAALLDRALLDIENLRGRK